LALSRKFDGVEFMVSGMPVYDRNGVHIGYEIRVEEIEEVRTQVDAVSGSTPGALFGKHLAPVLRQPLGRIIANAETIGSELQGPIRENYALYARDIANAARHLSALVDDLGDLEAVERPDFYTARDNIELGDVARRVAGLLALKAADHSIRISTPLDSEKVPAVAEFRRVLQVMLNLVTNAIRYSQDGTEVLIETASKDGDAFISVSDKGEGIPEDSREKIFEKFERLGRSGDGGSGLGLYMSVSEAAGGGAKFTLRLPTQ
jgi:signal transduction histidine kinase